MPRAQDLPFTCKQAWNRITASGMLPPARMAVYELLGRDGPLTEGEIDARINPHAHKRVSEMVRQGVVHEVGTRLCSVSGQEAYVWDVTDTCPPRPLPKPPKGAVLTGRAKALAEIQKRIPEKKRSPELRQLLAELEAEQPDPPEPSDYEPSDFDD